MEKIIIYGSQYGTTKRYAEELSKRTGMQAVCYEDIKDLSPYQTILYFGGLYAGGMLGLSKTIKLLPANRSPNLILVSVGLADITDASNTDNIKASIRKQIPEEFYAKANLFHLRGGIDYQKLNFAHKTMMRLLYNKVKKLPPEKQTAETRAMVETYNQTVDFVNLNNLEQIIEVIS